MRKHILFLTAGFVVSSSVAMAESDYYITPQIGYSYQNNKFDFEPVDRIDAPEVTKERFRNSAIYNLTLGKRIYDSTFLELEVAYSPNRRFTKDVSIYTEVTPKNYNFSTKLTNISAFVNINHKFQNILPLSVTPYLLGGVGYSSNKIKNIAIGSSETTQNLIVNGKKTNSFAWQLGAGLLFPITQNLDMDLTYKFRSLGKFKSDYIYRPLDGEVFEGETVVRSKKLYTSDILLGVAIHF
jgi:opacity protein-like surface antigen